MSYSNISNAALSLALPSARGAYQASLLRGSEALSGGTLRGKAKSYSGRYRASAHALLSRLIGAGFIVTEGTGPHGRRILTVRLPCERELQG